MNKKENGAAMVLALLVLMFFMGLALNVFFIAEKKTKKAGVRVIGSKAQAVVDSGANIGLYEVRTAYRYMRGSTNANTSVLATSQGGIVFGGSERVRPMRSTSAYIRTSVFHEYFNGYEVDPSDVQWRTPATTDSTTSGSITPSAISKMWHRAQTNTTMTSIGGYTLDIARSVNLSTINDHFHDNGFEEFGTTAVAAVPIDVVVVVRKRLITPAVTVSGIRAVDSMNINITYTSTATLEGSGTRKRITSERAGDLVVSNEDN